MLLVQMKTILLGELDYKINTFKLRFVPKFGTFPT
jgi:hypothetical protein